MPSLTLVTGFLDIGRETWSSHARSRSKYLEHLENVCRLHNHLTIWVDLDLVETVRAFRAGIPAPWRTVVNPFTLADCRLWSHKERIEEIMVSYQTRKWEHIDANRAPEYTQPLYDLTVNQKIDWLRLTKEQCESTDTGTDYYTWIDGGYTHSTIDFSHGAITLPAECEGKVSLGSIWQWAHWPRDMIEFLYHWPIVILAGGFICVDTRLVDVFHALYYNLVEKCLNQGIIDDDQFILTFLLTDHPHLFSVLKGDWFACAHAWFKPHRNLEDSSST